MPPIINAFYDTNVLLYAVDTHPSAREKQNRAVELLLRTDFGVSAQVLAEFFFNATRKLPTPLSGFNAREFIERLADDQPVVPVDAELVLSGIDVAQRYQLSYWDGAVVAAAQRLGVPTLYSEDLSHGQTYGGVRVLNPFV